MNIPLEALLWVRTVVTHAACPDGIASALILKDALGSLPGFRIVFAQHGTAALRDLPAEPGMLFCDITPPRERVAEFVAAGAIVLDHHRTKADIVAAFGPLGIFADEKAEPGVSGALLAFERVWLPTQHMASARRQRDVNFFAVLAGIRDTWQRKDPRWSDACAQAAALRFWPADALLDTGMAGLREKLAIGHVLLAKDAERDARSIAEAYRFEVNGTRVLCFEGYWTSDIADQLADEIDVVLGWHYSNADGSPQMEVSCRSRGSFSAGDFAKAYRGGGHTQASGFKVKVVSGKLGEDPYAVIRALVTDYLDRPAQ